MRKCLVGLVAGAAVVLTGCELGSDELAKTESKTSAPRPTKPKPEPTAICLGKPYRASGDEQHADIKQAASKIAERVTTHKVSTTPAEAAAASGLPPSARRELQGLVAPWVKPDRPSCGRTVYPQLSGLQGDTAGVMVAVRTTGSRASHSAPVRVLDVRMRRVGSRWVPVRIASFGGTPVPRPPGLPTAAVRVLDNPRITLTDSARWDIHRGAVDRVLLTSLVRAAQTAPISVLVLGTGHPPKVWGTNRVSGHTPGRAADIWKVGTRPVAEDPTAATNLARGFLARGAVQVGSPRTLGARSFTDAVHQDHVHVQQR